MWILSHCRSFIDHSLYTKKRTSTDRRSNLRSLTPSMLTPRCRTLKECKLGIFSPYLRLATFQGFKMSSLNYMSLRDFEKFSVFLEILCFFVPHYTRQILKKSDEKRNDHVFPKLNEPSCFLQIFVLENNIFYIFYSLFPD